MSSSDHRLPAADSPLFILVAGEASGDLLGADLIDGLRERFPKARFAGIGGPQMQRRGMQVWHPLERLSVMGFSEVLRHLPELLRIRGDVRRRTLREKPAAFIGVDAPDFNLGLERRLKRAGVRTVHYVVSRVLITLIALHIIAALYHALILRDGLLGRMFFGRRTVTSAPASSSAKV